MIFNNIVDYNAWSQKKKPLWLWGIHDTELCFYISGCLISCWILLKGPCTHEDEGEKSKLQYNTVLPDPPDYAVQSLFYFGRGVGGRGGREWVRHKSKEESSLFANRLNVDLQYSLFVHGWYDRTTCLSQFIYYNVQKLLIVQLMVCY